MKKSERKAAIVTGASRGLGKRIALKLAEQAVDIVVNYVANKTEADNVVNEIRAKGGNAIAVQADVSIASDVERLFSAAITHFNKIHIIVNNAGIMITRPLGEFSEAEFDRQFSTNVKSVFLMMKLALGTLENNGRIINISSSVSRLMLPDYAVYSATKAAVEQMTRVLAKEAGAKGITVNCVLPGPMNTELFLKGKSEETIRNISGLSAFNRIGEVDDILPVILFLAGNDSQWITGQNIGVNGGMV